MSKSICRNSACNRGLFRNETFCNDASQDGGHTDERAGDRPTEALPTVFMSALTADNLKRINGGGPSKEEAEEALWQKMQTLSALLGQVDDALETATSAPPSTGASQRPPLTGGSHRPTSQRGQTPLGSAPPPGTGGSVRSTASKRGYAPEAPQLLTVHEAEAYLSKRTTEPAPVQLVSYTGSQSNVAGIVSRRHNREARAAGSSIGACFGWDP